jgi:hypothetical protein
MMPRKFFFKLGGQDEDYSGYYGFSDSSFQECHRRMGVNQGTYSWKLGTGIWAVYDLKEKSAGFSRNTTRNEVLWRQKMSEHKFCNMGPIARVPYKEAYRQRYD